MGWRYRKSFSILPGLRLNLGKSGFSSLSVGGRGATLNLGKKGVTGTVSLPGTGLSYQHRFKNPPSALQTPAPLPGAVPVPSGRTFPVRAIVIVALVVGGGYLALRPPIPPSSPAVPLASTTAPAAQAAVTTANAAPDGPRTVVPQVAARSPGASIQTRQVTTIQANVRATPSMSGPVTRTLPKGQVVQVLQTENGWSRVAEQNGEGIGWMYNSVLK